jgi:hypothetical protein
MNEQYKQELPAWLQIELEKEEIMKNTKNTHYVDFSNSNADKITSTSTTSMKQETLEEVAKRIYGSEPSKDVEYYAFIAGAKWQQEQDRWKTVYEETPPIHVALLVKSPEGIIHLSSWRESYNIFSCQAKSESSFNWKWKTI